MLGSGSVYDEAKSPAVLLEGGSKGYSWAYINATSAVFASGR